jgi:hypothetical protein
MADPCMVRENDSPVDVAHPGLVWVLARVFLWLSVVLVVVAALGLGVVVVHVLAPHAAPAGGGG